MDDPELLESRAFLLAILFGAAYAIYSWRTHSLRGACAPRPGPKAKKAPWIFLFRWDSLLRGGAVRDHGRGALGG